MSTTKYVFITGCSDGGIGAGLVHAFANRGFHVFATARSIDKMTSFTRLENVTMLQLDVTNDDHIMRVVQAVQSKTGGRLDILVNNAGRNHFMPQLDESIASAKAVFDTNVWGVLALDKMFSALLIAAKGVIVNVTSVSGHLNIPWMGTYAASKRSMEIMADTLRLELLPFGVRVISVVTGAVKTNGLVYMDSWKLPSNSIYTPIEPTIRRFVQGSGIKTKQLTPAEYAEQVVSNVLRERTSGIHWGPGLLAGFIKFATGWLPTRALDSMWIRGTGIDEMLSQS